MRLQEMENNLVASAFRLHAWVKIMVKNLAVEILPANGFSQSCSACPTRKRGDLHINNIPFHSTSNTAAWVIPEAAFTNSAFAGFIFCYHCTLPSPFRFQTCPCNKTR